MNKLFYILVFLAPILNGAEKELVEQYYTYHRLWPQSISELNRKENNEQPMDPFLEYPPHWIELGDRKNIIKSYLSWNADQKNDESSLLFVVLLEELGITFSSVEGSRIKVTPDLLVSVKHTPKNIELFEKLSDGLTTRRQRPSQTGDDNYE